MSRKLKNEEKNKLKEEKKSSAKEASKDIKKKEKNEKNEISINENKEKKPKKSIWKKIKIIFIIILCLVVITGIGLAVINIWMPVKQKDNTIKFSDVKDYCDDLNNCNITELLFENVSYFGLLDIELKEVEFDVNENEYELVVWAYGTFNNMKEYRFDFKIKDDMGPYLVKENSCIYYIGQDFDINKCLKINDYSDGSVKIKDSNIDYKGLDLTKVGKGKIIVTVEDEDENESEFEINLKVRNVPISDFKFSKSNSSSVETNKTVKWETIIKPVSVEDKSVKWSSEDESVATVDENGNIKGVKKGSTKICATSNYEKDKKVCDDIDVTVECKQSYTFTFASNEGEKIVAGEDFCPGKYKFYADSVENSYSWYYIYVYKNSNSSSSSYTIEKDSDYWNDEGKIISIEDGGYIKLDEGILKFRLVRVS